MNASRVRNFVAAALVLSSAVLMAEFARAESPTAAPLNEAAPAPGAYHLFGMLVARGDQPITPDPTVLTDDDQPEMTYNDIAAVAMVTDSDLLHVSVRLHEPGFRFNAPGGDIVAVRFSFPPGNAAGTEYIIAVTRFGYSYIERYDGDTRYLFGQGTATYAANEVRFHIPLSYFEGVDGITWDVITAENINVCPPDCDSRDDRAPDQGEPPLLLELP